MVWAAGVETDKICILAEVERATRAIAASSLQELLKFESKAIGRVHISRRSDWKFGMTRVRGSSKARRVYMAIVHNYLYVLSHNNQ